MRRLLVATTNTHKLREIEGLLAGVEVELVPLTSFPPIVEPDEVGATFEENARLKALYYDRSAEALRHTFEGFAEFLDDFATHQIGGAGLRASGAGHETAAHGTGGAALQRCELTVAEDSGLVIDALDGEPGVQSARFLRPDASYPERFDDIFRRLAARPDRPRTARFLCALALVANGDVLFETSGVLEGEIAREPRGDAGFGYDPIFYYPPYGCTLAEVTEASKLHVAHRGQAFRALAAWLGSESVQSRFRVNKDQPRPDSTC